MGRCHVKHSLPVAVNLTTLNMAVKSMLMVMEEIHTTVMGSKLRLQY